MSAFSRETIHDVKDVIVTRRSVESMDSIWDTFEVEIIDTEGNSKALLLFGSEGKTMRYQSKDNED